MAGSLAIGIGYAVVMAWVLRYTAGSVTGSMLSGDTGAYFGAIVGDFGSIGWHMLAMAITFVVMIAGINSGIERINKFMMPLFFLLFLIMAIRVAFLPAPPTATAICLSPSGNTCSKPTPGCMP